MCLPVCAHLYVDQCLCVCCIVHVYQVHAFDHVPVYTLCSCMYSVCVCVCSYVYILYIHTRCPQVVLSATVGPTSKSVTPFSRHGLVCTLSQPGAGNCF